MIEFAWPYLFAALPLPLLVARFAPRASAQPVSALRVPFFSALESLTGPTRMRRSGWRLTWAGLAWLLLVLAASRPQFVGAPLQLPLSGRDLMLAVDISGSMEVDDMWLQNQRVPRLTAVKTVAGDFIQRRQGDRIGLILFGSQAYLQTPLTFDRDTVHTLLNEAAIGLAGKETAIGDAIGLAVKRLQTRNHRVLILLTDGTNTAGRVDPLKAADLAVQAGLRIYTIGVGADEMIMRDLFGARRANPSAELDETTLTAIAEKTGGRYFRARGGEGLMEIYKLLDELEPTATEEEVFRPVRELYVWPLGTTLAITLALAATALVRPARES